VAERAILARAVGRGYELGISRWGGTDRVVAAVCDGADPTDLPDLAWRQGGHTPSMAVLARRLDYLGTAAVYRIEPAGTTAFLPLWFGLPLPDVRPVPACGALVAVRSLAEVRVLRVRFRRLKGVLADALRAGTTPATAAPLVLRAAVAGLGGRERYCSVPTGSR